MDNETTGPRRKGAGSFFGRRHGKTLRPLHASLLETLLPELRLDLETARPSNLRELFGAPVDMLRLEIGFGGGEHLSAQTAAKTRTPALSASSHSSTAWPSSSPRFMPSPADNIRLFNQDAALLLDWLPAASLSHVDILYPDPWPKKRQHKRRFISPENLVRLARCIKPGGKLCFASDIADYVNWTLLHVRAHGGFVFDAQDADDWRVPYAGWPGTRYEAKAFREGRTPAYLTFTRSRRLIFICGKLCLDRRALAPSNPAERKEEGQMKKVFRQRRRCAGRPALRRHVHRLRRLRPLRHP